jgi:two-component SAPR family response regulator
MRLTKKLIASVPMSDPLEHIRQQQQQAEIQVFTLGSFSVWRHGQAVPDKEWGRDKTIQLFQYFVTARHRKAQHKEQIMDRLWEEDGDSGDQNFKVALHGVNKVLEPNRKSHSEARYVIRQGLTYQLDRTHIWVDADALEAYIACGNQWLHTQPARAQEAYRAAIDLYKGTFLPNRIYEDWSCDERERLQVLTLGTITTLSGLLLEENPMESIRLAQQALIMDVTCEEAYRLQMNAWFRRGNRPMVIKIYRQCERVLDDEMGIEPLPETKKLLKMIEAA